MRTTLLRTLGLSVGAAAIAALAFGASAQEKKPAPAKKPAACSTIKDMTACNAREDCNWVEAKKGKGACKAKPTPKAEKKTK